MVFVPRRFEDFVSEPTREIRTPVAITLTAVAVAGWAVAAFLAAQFIYFQPHRPEAALRAAPSDVSQGCGAQL